MTDQEIMQLAKEAGFSVGEYNGEVHVLTPVYEDLSIAEYVLRFATLVAEREREACARLVENQRYAVLQVFRTYTADELVQSLKSDAKTLAKMIRARGKKENNHG